MDIVNAIAAQVTLEQMTELYQKRDMSALKGAIEAQKMVQSEITAMIRDVMPDLAQNVDILV